MTDDTGRIEAIARALYCDMENVDPETNEAHIGCFFAPFNGFANDESKVLMNEYRVSARKALAALRKFDADQAA